MRSKQSKLGRRVIGAAAILGAIYTKPSSANIFIWTGAAGNANWNVNTNWFNQTAGAISTTFPGNTTNQSAKAVIADTVFDYTQGYYSGTPTLPAPPSVFVIPSGGIELDTIEFGFANNNGDLTLASNVSVGSSGTTITLNTTSGGLNRLATGTDGVIGGVNGGAAKGLSYSGTAGTQTILSNVISNASQTWVVGGTSGELLVDGTISTTSAAVVISKKSTGELEIASNNSAGFLGSYVAQAGTTLLDSGGSVGSSPVEIGDTTATNSSTLLTNSGVTFPNNVISVTNNVSQTETLGGGGNPGSSTWTGNLTLNYPVSLTGGPTGTTTFSGKLSDGTGGTDNLGKAYNFSGSTVTKVDTGTVILSASNTYSGGTNVSAGTLTGTGPSAFGTGFLIVNPTGGTGTSADAATVNTINSIAPTAAVTVNTNSATAIGTVNFNGTIETIGSLAGNGNVVLNNPAGTSLVTGNSTSTTFSGIISDANGAGSLTKAGTGTLTLSGANTYGGITNASSGTLLVTNTTGSATGTGPVLVAASAVLGGSGIIAGSVIVNGTLAPGVENTASPTTITIGAGSVLGGAVVLDLTGANLSDEISFAGSGSPNLSGGTLDVANTTASLAAGQSFTLFNFGSNAPIGTFASPLGLPELSPGLSWNTSSLYTSGTISIAGSSTSSASGIWSASTTTGTWENTANWAGGVEATGAGQSASFADSSASTAAVTLTAPETVGTLNFNGIAGTTAYTLTGSNTLTLSSGTSSPAVISVTAGSQTINAPIALTAGLNINTAAGSSLTIGGSVNASAGALTVTSGSTLSLSSTAVLNLPLVAAGTIIFANNSTGSSYLVRTVPSLNLSGGTVILAAGSQPIRQLLSIGTGGLTGSGLIDLTSNDLQLQSGGSLGLTQISSFVAQGSAGGTWQGSSGITSSTVAADPRHLTALAVIENQSGNNVDGVSVSTFDGAPTSTSDVLVKYTYYGDTNLDGAVDGSDYSRIDSAYLADLATPAGDSLPATGWANGDFNYDGVVNGSDYTLIDNAFNSQGASLAVEVASPTAQLAGTTGSASVPEPASLALAGFGVVGLLRRRRR